MARAVMICAVALWTALSWAGAAQAQAQLDGAGATLTVVGEGAAQAVPDLATIRVGVTHDGRTATDALQRVSRATGDLLSLLSELGIAQPDMQTSTLSLQPVWGNRTNSDLSGGGAREILGYRADNAVTIQVRTLADLGAMLDDVVAGGANRFDGLSFGMQDPQPLLDAARRAAVADARRKAELYAEAAGVALGPILSISEPGGAGRGAPEMAMSLSRADVPVAAGAVEMRAQVTLVYQIAQP